MEIIQYQVDAFTNQVFSGNPAAVCPLKSWLPDTVMQKIAEENNLAETAFFVPEKNHFYIRWFTPTIEIDLAGHPTLAATHVLYEHLGYNKDEVVFHSQSGELRVKKTKNKNYQLNFPSRKPIPSNISKQTVNEALGMEPDEIWESRDIMVVVKSEEHVQQLNPHMENLKQLHDKGIIVTAKGENADFVSRFFAPSMGIPEDPVTGSAHCTLIPYWADRLNKNQMQAIQLSKRKGYLNCGYQNDRVTIGGQAITFLIGTIYI